MTKLRPAEAADSESLGRLGALLVTYHHGLDPERFIPPTTRTADGYGRFLASELRRPNVVVLVAHEAGEVVGYAYASIEGQDWMTLRGPAGVIHDLVVEPARRRRGVGRLLLASMLTALSERGAPQVVLSTAARNEAAQTLFASAGFRATMVEMTRERPATGPGGPQA